MRQYTIGHIKHNEELYKKHLGPSLENLKGNFKIITTTDQKKPAANYNDIIDSSTKDLILFLHEDVSFSSNLLHAIDTTISILKEQKLKFSALGIVGRNYNTQYDASWCGPAGIYRYETVDCCFILIDKSDNHKFDDKTFDDFHLYVEDYCIGVEEKTGNGIYSILVNGFEGVTAPADIDKYSHVIHHSATVIKLGGGWGKYHYYKQRLNDKYQREIKTT